MRESATDGAGTSDWAWGRRAGKSDCDIGVLDMRERLDSVGDSPNRGGVGPADAAAVVTAADWDRVLGCTDVDPWGASGTTPGLVSDSGGGARLGASKLGPCPVLDGCGEAGAATSGSLHLLSSARILATRSAGGAACRISPTRITKASMVIRLRSSWLISLRIAARLSLPSGPARA